jgi:hypothetical protein
MFLTVLERRVEACEGFWQIESGHHLAKSVYIE